MDSILSLIRILFIGLIEKRSPCLSIYINKCRVIYRDITHNKVACFYLLLLDL